MVAILGAITGLGGIFKGIADDLSNIQIAKINAQTDQQRNELSQKEQELHDKRAVLVAEAWSRINAFMRASLAAGPSAYLLKVFLWDKVIGGFTGHSCFHNECSVFNTDPLDDNLWKVVSIVLAFYFVTDLGSAALKKLRG